MGDGCVVVGSKAAENSIVTKVGRKLLTVRTDHGRGREIQFDIASGQQSGAIYGAGYSVRTTEQHAFAEMRAISVRRLHALTSRHYWLDSLTVQQMDAISTIIESGNKP